MRAKNNIPKQKTFSSIIRSIALLLCATLLFEQTGFAQIAEQIDISGHLSQLRQALTADKFRPLHLRYLSYDDKNNGFELLLDEGDLKNINPSQIEKTSKKLLQYFTIGVTLPNEAFWVNLRPDASDQIIDPELAQTDVGKVMLESDLQLKKDVAKYTSPNTAEGKIYWDRVYKKAAEILGYENIRIPTITRPWIVPDEIIIRETKDNAYIYKATLKVMLEQDYLKDSETYNFKDERLKQLNEYSSELIRELIIPKLTGEINSSKRYAALRQVYYSLILAQWFKERFKDRGGLYSSLIDRRDLTGLTSPETWSKDTYFKQYQQSFKDGEYNFKETVSTPFGQSIRSYFSGGINYMGIVFGQGAAGVRLIRGRPSDNLVVPGYAAMAKVGSDGEIKVTSAPVQNQAVVEEPVSEIPQSSSIPAATTHNQGKKNGGRMPRFLKRIMLFAAVIWLFFAHPLQSQASDQGKQDNQQKQEQVQGQATKSLQDMNELLRNMQKTRDKINQLLEEAKKISASSNVAVTAGQTKEGLQSELAYWQGEKLIALHQISRVDEQYPKGGSCLIMPQSAKDARSVASAAYHTANQNIAKIKKQIKATIPGHPGYVTPLPTASPQSSTQTATIYVQPAADYTVNQNMASSGEQIEAVTPGYLGYIFYPSAIGPQSATQATTFDWGGADLTFPFGSNVISAGSPAQGATAEVASTPLTATEGITTASSGPVAAGSKAADSTTFDNNPESYASANNPASASVVSEAAGAGNLSAQQPTIGITQQDGGQPSASLSNARVLLPVEQQSFQDISQYVKSGPYYEIETVEKVRKRYFCFVTQRGDRYIRR